MVKCGLLPASSYQPPNLQHFTPSRKLQKRSLQLQPHTNTMQFKLLKLNLHINLFQWCNQIVYSILNRTLQKLKNIRAKCNCADSFTNVKRERLSHLKELFWNFNTSLEQCVHLLELFQGNRCNYIEYAFLHIHPSDNPCINPIKVQVTLPNKKSLGLVTHVHQVAKEGH